MIILVSFVMLDVCMMVVVALFLELVRDGDLLLAF